MIKTRLFTLVTDSKKYIAGNVIFQWLNLICNMIMVTVIANMLTSLLGGESVNLASNAIIILALVAVRIVVTKLAHKASYYASRSVKKTIRARIYEKLLSLGSTYTKSVPTAEVVQLAGEGVEQLETYFGSYLPQFFYSLLAPLTLFIYVSRISFKVAIILLIFVPLIPMAIVVVQKIAKRLLAKYWGQYATLGDNFLENLQGLTTLKIYQADEKRHEKMNQEAEHFREITMKVLTMQLNSIIVMDVVAYGGAAIGILLTIIEMIHGNIDFHGAFIIILLSADFFLPMRQLGSYFHVAMNGMAASDKIFALLDLPEDEGRTEEVKEAGDFTIKSMNFAYEEGKETLSDINMSIPQGGFSAFVGESGCGKSTIASILMGKNNTYEGSVTFAGKEMKTIKEASLMKNITLVSNNSYIFKGSVRENLLMGDPNASDERLYEVLGQVKLKDFIMAEGGLDLKLLEGGTNLSGGQRQRLAIARALLHDTPVYIFDEATSNIDVESENDIMELIKKLKETRTIILISHRLFNVTDADKIYVLKDGRLVEEGRHDELIDKNGSYAGLWKKQQALENIRKEAM